MTELSDNIRYYLADDSGDSVLIEEIKNFRQIGGDEYSLEKHGHFKVEKRSKATLLETGYRYVLGKLLGEGPNANIRLQTYEKDDRTFDQDWKLTSEVTVDMFSLVFHEENDSPSVEVELVQDNLLKLIGSRFDDDFDVTAEGLPELPYVNIRHKPRQIFKRSRFVASGQTVPVVRDQGDTARAVLLEVDFTSEDHVGGVYNYLANSSGGGYASLSTSGNTFITNCPRKLIYKLNGKVKIRTVNKSFSGSYFRMDLVRYTNGEDTNFDEIIQAMGSIDPRASSSATIIEYDFDDFELIVEAGESIGIMTLSDAGGLANLELEFVTDEATNFTIETETPYPVTYSKGVRPEDMFRHLARVATDKPDLEFVTSVFGSGQRHENKLLVHGSWLRNMPQVINEGEEDERRLQCELSLADLYGGYGILEPLRWDGIRYKGKETFIVGAEKDIQQNFVGVRLGETTDTFRLIEPKKKARNVIGENYYGSIKLGSETSGSNYGEVNNLYSICGNAKWGTVNRLSESVYERLTDFHTGAEDIELERQKQWSDYPDIDTPNQNDWFLIDCKKEGSEYTPKGWSDYYSEAPKNVYSVESNYNWPFAPLELLRGHGYKIAAALAESPGGRLGSPVGECTLSLVTKRAGEDEIKSSDPFPHSLLEPPRVRLMAHEFEITVTQEIVDQLRGETNGVDNKFGLVEILWRGETVYCRTIEASTDNRGKFRLIEAK